MESLLSALCCLLSALCSLVVSVTSLCRRVWGKYWIPLSLVLFAKTGSDKQRIQNSIAACSMCSYLRARYHQKGKRLRASQPRSELLSIFTTGQNYKVQWAAEEEVIEELSIRRPPDPTYVFVLIFTHFIQSTHVVIGELIFSTEMWKVYGSASYVRT